MKLPKTIRLNGRHYFIMKISNKKELQQIAPSHSSDIDFKDLMKLCKNYAKEPYLFIFNEGYNFVIRLLVRKLNQSITKSSKTKLNMI